MLKNFKLIFILILFVVAGKSCVEKKEETPSNNKKVKKSINPNGDSELALLMRDLFDEAEQIKKQVSNQEAITLKLDYKKILTAHATEPDKASSSEFKTFANSYIATMQRLEDAKPGEALKEYHTMVNLCMNCHQSFCPGPMMRIKKLKIK